MKKAEEKKKTSRSRKLNYVERLIDEKAVAGRMKEGI